MITSGIYKKEEIAIDLHINDIESRAEQESKKKQITEQIDRAMKRTKTVENHVKKNIHREKPSPIMSWARRFRL